MSLSKALVALGAVLVVLGLAVPAVQRHSWLYSWFGNLPGDIRYEGRGGFFFAPISSLAVVSVVLTALAALLRRFWNP